MRSEMNRGGKHGQMHKAGKFIKFRPINSKMKKPYLGTVLRCYDGKKRMIILHVMVAKYFLGPRPVGKTINHENGDKADCSSRNLSYVTLKENIRHAMVTGLMGHICDDDVVKIRKLFDAKKRLGLSNSIIGQMFNVSFGMVSQIGNRKTRLDVA